MRTLVGIREPGSGNRTSRSPRSRFPVPGSRFATLSAIAVACVLAAACEQDARRYDLIVRGGDVIDGSGQPARRADVGIAGDRITAIGDLSSAAAGRVIDASGLMVAPGFIDVQGQSGTTLLADGNAESHIRQGITSEIIGEGGSPAFWTAADADAESLAPFGITVDWTGFSGYFDRLRQSGTTVNVGTFVPATMVRRNIIGMDNRPPTADELARMEAMVDQAMRDGAFGLSSALIYVPGSFARTDELVALAKVAAKHKGIYITHIRGESFNLFNALDEAIAIGRDAGLPVVIFHLKVGAKANWGRMKEAVAKIEQANAAGGRVTATMYPYAAGGPACRPHCRCGYRKAAAKKCWSGSRIPLRGKKRDRRLKPRSTGGRTC